MTEEQIPMSEESPAPGAQASSEEAWKEVGRQFEALGQSLASAFRAAWKDEEVRRQAGEMKTGLESMVQEVGRAIKASTSSPEMHQARSEAAQAAESLRTAGEQTVQEVRPVLLSALQQVNQELQKIIQRLEGERTADGAPEGVVEQTPEPPSAPDAETQPQA